MAMIADKADPALGAGLLGPGLTALLQQFAVGLAQCLFIQQVRAPLGGPEQRLLAAPGGDGRVVARAQHVRHVTQRVLGRLAVVRAVEQAEVALEAVLRRRGSVES